MCSTELNTQQESIHELSNSKISDIKKSVLKCLKHAKIAVSHYLTNTATYHGLSSEGYKSKNSLSVSKQAIQTLNFIQP